MNRQPATLAVVVALLVGCAVAPPAPPLTEPITDAPQEYRWSPFRWERGKKLAYRMRFSREREHNERRDSQGGGFEFSATGLGPSATGLQQVRLEVDGSPIGTLLIDPEGVPREGIPANPEQAKQFAESLRMVGWDLARRLGSRVMRLQERVLVDAPVSDLVEQEFLDLAGSWLEESVALEYEFLGYQRLGAARVVTIRHSTPNIVKRRLPGETVEYDTFTINSVIYLHAEHGYQVAGHTVALLAGRARDGKRSAMRLTGLLTPIRK